MYEYVVKYYGRGCFVGYAYEYANSKADAVLNARKHNEIVEVICCRELEARA